MPAATLGMVGVPMLFLLSAEAVLEGARITRMARQTGVARGFGVPGGQPQRMVVESVGWFVCDVAGAPP